ncbi:hypothetical protein GIY62_32220 [Burkholderia plantarii]|uniref:hypothetical protein n=1 Tax=Burkholderia plantarii TaxID=41899 RepID=UPI00272B8994|nr:hypothetical protein [Burkholderia plantarii]WLE62071.1 hypothetical protein GIY62_32220 [Burkholderia plantarii]
MLLAPGEPFALVARIRPLWLDAQREIDAHRARGRPGIEIGIPSRVVAGAASPLVW